MGLTVLYIQNLIRQIMEFEVRFLRMGWGRKFLEFFFFLMEVEINMEAAKQSHISFLISSCVFFPLVLVWRLSIQTLNLPK